MNAKPGKIAVQSLDPREIVPGYKARFVHSERMSFVYWEIDKGAPLPHHSHEHEQVAHILEGEFELVVNGIANHLRAGDVFVIPSHAPHSGMALTDCKIMDAFCPVREDYVFEK